MFDRLGASHCLAAIQRFQDTTVTKYQGRPLSEMHVVDRAVVFGTMPERLRGTTQSYHPDKLADCYTGDTAGVLSNETILLSEYGDRAVSNTFRMLLYFLAFSV